MANDSNVIDGAWIAEQVGVEESDLQAISGLRALLGKRDKAGNYRQDKAIPGAFAFMRWQRDDIQQVEIAELTGYAAQRIPQMTAEGIIKRRVDGSYDRKATMHSLFAWFRERLHEGKSVLGDLKQQKMERENRLLEYQLQREEGLSHPAAAVEREWGNAMLNCRQKLLRIGNKVAPMIPYLHSEQEIEAAIQTEVEEALAELSRPMDYSEKRDGE